MRNLVTTRLRRPSLPASIVLPVTIVFACLTCARGADWLFVHKPGTISAVMLDNGVGLAAWGAGLMLGAIGLIVAYIADRHFPVWCFHVVLVSIYFGIFVTTSQVVVGYGGGIQNLVAPIGGVVWHSVLSRTMRPLPPHLGGDRAR